MSFFALASILIAVAALFMCINDRWLRMPSTIGVMLIAMLASLLLIVTSALTGGVNDRVRDAIHSLDFSQLLLQGMLAFLLFAGAMSSNVGEMRRQWGTITALSIVSTILSTAAIGCGLYGVMAYLGWTVPLLSCLVFGALISPTDPIAVVGMLKSAKAPVSLEAQLAGESLFNDGIGIVLFQVLLEVSTGHASPDGWLVLRLFLIEAGGGMILGLVCGGFIYWLLKRNEQHQTELLLTIALAMGVYSLGSWLHVSAAIAVVVAGLIIGGRGRHFAMTEASRHNLDTFWEMVDSVLNAVLFLLIGVGVLMLPFNKQYLVAGVFAIVISLAARWLSVAGIIQLIGVRKRFMAGTISILTWGGLRGGIAVAMALSLPHDAYRDLLLTAAYSVVVFSVIVQGLTIGRVIEKHAAAEASMASR